MQFLSECFSEVASLRLPPQTSWQSRIPFSRSFSFFEKFSFAPQNKYKVNIPKCSKHFQKNKKPEDNFSSGQNISGNNLFRIATAYTYLFDFYFTDCSILPRNSSRFFFIAANLFVTAL